MVVMTLNSRNSRIFIFLILANLASSVSGQQQWKIDEGYYYEINEVPIPADVVLEVGGLAFDQKNRLGVCTRRGDIWMISNPESERPDFKRFAHGLHEPLGLAWKDGAFITNQRGELTRITDNTL